MQEVSSTLQSDVMNKVTVNLDTRFLSPCRCVVKTGNCSAQPVFVQIQKRHMNLTESLEELGIIKGTSEMNRTAQILRIGSSVGENTA